MKYKWNSLCSKKVSLSKWNYLRSVTVWSVAIALAFGNVVVPTGLSKGAIRAWAIENANDAQMLVGKDVDSQEKTSSDPTVMEQQVLDEQAQIEKIYGEALVNGEDVPNPENPGDPEIPPTTPQDPTEDPENVYGFDTSHLAIKKIVSDETKLVETVENEEQHIITYTYEDGSKVIVYAVHGEDEEEYQGEYKEGTIIATAKNGDYAIYDVTTTYTKLVIDGNVKIYDDELNEILPFMVNSTSKYVELDILNDAIVNEPKDTANYISTFNWVVQRALDYARDNEEKSVLPYKVILPRGNYVGEEPLHIYSNTTLDATGSTIKATKTNRALLETGIAAHKTENGDKDWSEQPSVDYAGYDYFKNIEIIGGVWDGNGDEKSEFISSMFCIAHVTNFSLTGCTLQKTYNTHMIEIGAANGFNVKDCTFQNDCIDVTDSNSYEAIQLDTSHDREDNFPHFYVQDDLATINVDVSGCTFKKLRRGIGNHHYVAGVFYENINVHDNEFVDIEDKAVLAPYWKDSKIINNKMTNVGCAVKMKAVQNKMYLPNDRSINETNIKFEADLNNVISNNVIQLRNPNKAAGQYTPYGIYIGGVKVTSSDFYSGIVPVGTYYVNNIKVENNVITGRGIAGIHYDYSKNNIAQKNSIDWTGAGQGSTIKGRGIDTSYAGVSILENTIKNTPSSGHGIAIYDESDVVIEDNVLENIGYNGIHIGGSKAAKICNNSLTNIGANGISVIKDSEMSEVEEISNNTLTTIGKYGVNVTSSTISHLIDNRIRSSKEYGIYIGSNGTVVELNDNVLASCGKSNEIYIGGEAIDYKEDLYKLSKGDCAELAPELKSASGSIAYKSKNTKIAKVDASGKIVGVKTGTAVITATQNGCVAKTTVKIVKAPTKVTVPKKTVTLKKGKTYKIVPKVNAAATCHVYTYKTSKKKVATVSKAGKITAKKKGTAYITVKTYNKKSVKIKVKVKKK